MLLPVSYKTEVSSTQEKEDVLLSRNQPAFPVYILQKGWNSRETFSPTYWVQWYNI